MFACLWSISHQFMYSLVAALPSVPNVSAIRTIRVLRPLRSLTVIPGMRRLITALLKALPALGNVVILQVFVFMIFGILGIQLFGGGMNRRCRLTEFPVKMFFDNVSESYIWPAPDSHLQDILADPVAYKCADVDLLEYTDSGGKWTKETSPWHEPHDCYWPVDDSDQLLCAAPGQSGNHQCSSGSTCGTDYDTFGNPRFQNSRAMSYALWQNSLDYGMTTFDTIGRAFLTIFQSITDEGWTGIMYMAMDANQPAISAVFFVSLIVFASFFVMNLTLAVIDDEFHLDEDSSPTPEEAKSLELKKQTGQVIIKPRLSWLYKLVSHPTFNTFIMVVIIANTTVLSIDHYPMSTTLDSRLEIINFALSSVFLVEMVMKMLGLGIKIYALDKFNLFDAFVVFMSVLETITSPPSFISNQSTKKSTASALRSFRLFRVFKLARSYASLRELLALIVRAVASIANFGVLLFLFIYIYALVGFQVRFIVCISYGGMTRFPLIYQFYLQLFGNTMRFDPDGYLVPGHGLAFWQGDVSFSLSLEWSPVN